MTCLTSPTSVKSPACNNTSPSGTDMRWVLLCVSDMHTNRTFLGLMLVFSDRGFTAFTVCLTRILSQASIGLLVSGWTATAILPLGPRVSVSELTAIPPDAISGPGSVDFRFLAETVTTSLTIEAALCCYSRVQWTIRQLNVKSMPRFPSYRRAWCRRSGHSSAYYTWPLGVAKPWNLLSSFWYAIRMVD